MVRVGDWVKITGNDNYPRHHLKIGSLAKCIGFSLTSSTAKFVGYDIDGEETTQYVSKNDYKQVI